METAGELSSMAKHTYMYTSAVHVLTASGPAPFTVGIAYCQQQKTSTLTTDLQPPFKHIWYMRRPASST